jgi:phospholipase C
MESRRHLISVFIERRTGAWFALLAMAASIVACNGGTSGGNLPVVPFGLRRAAAPDTKIKHVIVVIQENRSFDNLFATFPGADGTLTGKAAAMPAPIASACASAGMQVITQATTVPLAEVPLEPQRKASGGPTDIDHLYDAFSTSYDQKNMDGFDLIKLGAGGDGPPACTYVYQYVNPKDIAPYWDMAQQYVLADHTFQVQGSGSFTGHQDLIAGGTKLNSNEALIDNPSYFPWGCDARTPNPKQHVNGVVTAVIKRGGKVDEYGGPFPCLTYTTMRDLLDAKSVSWKYYAMKVNKWFQNDPNSAGIWSAFDAIKAVRYSKEWKTNVTHNSNDILTDISKKQLPDVSWVTPDSQNSDHPGMSKDTGPSWVASIVNAVGQSSYWDSTAIVVVWDDWGGLYDHVSPPTPRDWQGGPGFRVPMLIVSPYVKPHVDSTVYEFGSILHFIEDNWNLGTLGRNDAHANSIRNAFDFKMAPRSFKVISAKYSREFFLTQQPSGLPPDTE